MKFMTKAFYTKPASHSVSFNCETWTFSTIRSKALLQPGTNVPRRLAFTVLDRLYERLHESLNQRFWPFLNVPWAFSTVLCAFETFLWTEKLRNGDETFRNGEERWMLKERSRTPKNVQGRWTFTFQNWKIHCTFKFDVNLFITPSIIGTITFFIIYHFLKPFCYCFNGDGRWWTGAEDHRT